MWRWLPGRPCAVRLRSGLRRVSPCVRPITRRPVKFRNPPIGEVNFLQYTPRWRHLSLLPVAAGRWQRSRDRDWRSEQRDEQANRVVLGRGPDVLGRGRGAAADPADPACGREPGLDARRRRPVLAAFHVSPPPGVALDGGTIHEEFLGHKVSFDGRVLEAATVCDQASRAGGDSTHSRPTRDSYKSMQDRGVARVGPRPSKLAVESQCLEIAL
jgi:hypothetical protein